jgi:hypothetical protein
MYGNRPPHHTVPSTVNTVAHPPLRTENKVTQEGRSMLELLPAGFIRCPSSIGDETERPRFGREPGVGIVCSDRHPVFTPGSEHPVFANEKKCDVSSLAL